MMEAWPFCRPRYLSKPFQAKPFFLGSQGSKQIENLLIYSKSSKQRARKNNNQKWPQWLLVFVLQVMHFFNNYQNKTK
jgi:hypothetical protein